MKRNALTYLLIMLLLTFTLSGCQKKGSETESINTTTDNTAEVTEEASPQTSQNQYASTTALELTELMGNGINLGNTMEAYGHSTIGTNSPVSTYETYWGQPVTTQDMITSMKAAGFDTLRIPVAWTNAMNYESGDYTIRAEYLDRVEEIINYALNEDMFVIVNDHWDGSWWGMFGSATQEKRDTAMEMYISMWTQIANRYKDYDDRLIFESANEELGDRLNDVDICADSGSLSVDDCYKTTNQINQTFVDTIRSTGGNNEQRFLLIAGYNTDIAMTCDDRFVMPTDTAANKLMVSVHYYTPWGFCGNSSLSGWGSKKNYDEQNELLAKLEKFTSNGYGVVIGEYAVALADDGSVKKDTCTFFENFLNNCDYYGYTPLLWDCSSLFIRRNLSFSDDAVAALFLNHSYSVQSALSQETIKNNAKSLMDEAYTSASEAEEAEGSFELASDEAIAWIMFNSSDWSIMYSVGDTYDPASKTDGLIATDVAITGAGTYTVSLDFTQTGTGYADSTTFAALAIANGETLYPGYIINIKEVLVNGEAIELNGKPYTTSDDGVCTRLNLYNEWVTSTPDSARTMDGSLAYTSTCLLDKENLGQIETITITFDYVAGR